MSSWSDKVVAVTGGSAGLGLSLAQAFAQHGAQVWLLARDPDRLQQAVQSIEQAGGRAIACAADITRQDEVDRAFAMIGQQAGRLDVLVNAAGRSDRGAVLETTPEQFQQLWELNFLAAVRCVRAAVPLLLPARGHLVNIGSLAAKSASRYLGAYPASKFPLAAYSQQLRLELEPQGLHVLLVCPGPIARADAGQRYDTLAGELPEAARRPGGGVQVQALDPQKLAQQILRACQRRQPELVLPGKARWLFALAQLWPRLGDQIVRWKTGG